MAFQPEPMYLPVPMYLPGEDFCCLGEILKVTDLKVLELRTAQKPIDGTRRK